MKRLINTLFLILFVLSANGQTVNRFHSRPIDSIIYLDTVKTPINTSQLEIFSSGKSINKRTNKKLIELKKLAELHFHKDTLGRIKDDEIYGVYLKRLYGIDFYLELNFNFDWTGSLKKVTISYLTDTMGMPLDSRLLNKINFKEIIDDTCFPNIGLIYSKLESFNGNCIIYTGNRKKLNIKN